MRAARVKRMSNAIKCSRNALILMLLLGVVPSAQAFRCGRFIVQVGDYSTEVLDKCGEPSFSEERLGFRAVQLRHPFGALQEYRGEEVLIEEWFYDFGPRKFQQKLVFENSRLVNIQQLKHGR